MINRKLKRLENKKGKSNIALLQPPTLASFRTWGSSTGASRTDLPVQSYIVL